MRQIMKQKKCDNCEYKGYSLEICKLHMKKMQCDPELETKNYKIKTMSKSAAYGAGIGVLTVIAGIAAAPVIGLKALIGHVAVTKASASGGVVGAGINVARNTSQKDKLQMQKLKRKTMAVPII
nr:magnetosome protein Mad7 [Desulfobacteraceae bacterium]